MSTTIYLVRHGETDFNRLKKLQGRGIDASLNDTGRGQAEKVADYLESDPIRHLYNSSLKRTIETLHPLKNRTGLPAYSDKDLDEMDFGDFEGRLMEDIQNDLIRIQNSWKSGDVELAIPGGESPVEVFERANQTVREQIDGHAGEPLLFMLHGRLIRILLSSWLGYGLQNMHQIEHHNGAIYKLEFKNGQFESHYLNYTEHLRE